MSYKKTNNHCREKHDCYINLQNIQAREIVPKHFLPAYSRLLHLNKKKNTWWSSDQHYKQTGGKQQTMHTPTDTVLKSVKINTLRWSKGRMWNNVTVLEEHISVTPVYTPSSWYTLGKFWYTLGCTMHPVYKHYCRLQFSPMVFNPGRDPRGVVNHFWRGRE